MQLLSSQKKRELSHVTEEDQQLKSITLLNNNRVDCEESSQDDNNSHLQSFMSMSSLQDELQTRFEVPQRVLSKMNFPASVFSYDHQLMRISQEEKDQILINKNRELLERQLEIMESQRVNVTEDSILSDMLPHAKPP